MKLARLSDRSKDLALVRCTSDPGRNCDRAATGAGEERRGIQASLAVTRLRPRSRDSSPRSRDASPLSRDTSPSPLSTHALARMKSRLRTDTSAQRQKAWRKDGEQHQFFSISVESDVGPEKRFTCPADKDLQMRSQVGAGWSSLGQSDSLGSTLHESEWESIRHALAKAEAFEQLEQRRVGRLISEVKQLKVQRKARNARDNQCHNCGFVFSGLAWLMSVGFIFCEGCKKCVCQNSSCIASIQSRKGNTRWLCLLCSKLIDVWRKGGVWFYKNLPSYDAVDKETISRLTPLLFDAKSAPERTSTSPLSKPRSRHSHGLGRKKSSTAEHLDHPVVLAQKSASLGRKTSRPLRRERGNKLYDATTSPPGVSERRRTTDPSVSVRSNGSTASNASSTGNRPMRHMAHKVTATTAVAAAHHNPAARGLDESDGSDRGLGADKDSLSKHISLTALDQVGLLSGAYPGGNLSRTNPDDSEGGASVVLPATLTRTGEDVEGFRQKAHSMAGSELIKPRRLVETGRGNRKSLPPQRQLMGLTRMGSLPIDGAGLHRDLIKRNQAHVLVPDEDLPGTAQGLEASMASAEASTQRPIPSRQAPIDESDLDVFGGHETSKKASRSSRKGPKRDLGNVEFSILYKGYENELHITIIRCKDLIAMDFHGTSDPFVKLQLLPHHNKSSRPSKYETSVKKRTLNPEYDESFVYYGIEKDEVHHLILRLIVYDYDTLTTNDFLGEVVFRMCSLQNDVLMTYCRELELAPRLRAESIIATSLHVQNTGLGKLLVSICYKADDKELRVGIVRAAGLPAVDILSRSCDPYVKCYLLPDPGRSSKRRTTILKRTVNPEFNEMFVYGVDARRLMASTLDISVWDYNYATRNSLIGCVRLNATSGPEVSQWLDAMYTPNETFTVWHNIKPKANQFKVTDL
eukprot:scpid13220/ scgid9765/ Double C2-like domain-containing protein alpha